MGQQMSTEQEKIEWLIDHEDMWVKDYQHHKDILKVKLARIMRAQGLYQERTKIHTINILPMLKKAKMKIDAEGIY